MKGARGRLPTGRCGHAEAAGKCMYVVLAQLGRHLPEQMPSSTAEIKGSDRGCAMLLYISTANSGNGRQVPTPRRESDRRRPEDHAHVIVLNQMGTSFEFGIRGRRDALLEFRVPVHAV